MKNSLCQNLDFDKGTKIQGNSTKGNFTTMVLAGSFINILKGLGVDKIAIPSMLNNNNKPIILPLIVKIWIDDLI